MTFKAGQSGNPGGRPSYMRRQCASLALSIRNRVDPEEIVTWLRELWLEGKDPLTQLPAPLSLRVDALQILLNRGWGQAAQHVIIEADVRNTLTGNEGVPAPAELNDVRARRQALRGAGVRQKVIEGTAVERKEMSVADVMPVDE